MMALNTLSMTFIFLSFALLCAIVSILNAWSINHVSDDAFEDGKENPNKEEYHIVGTAQNVRCMNIILTILSIMGIVISVVFISK